MPRSTFLRTAGRHATGSAAEFLPGLLLVPIVLLLQGPSAAAYFGVAWTGASLLFLVAGAVARSATADLARNPTRGPATSLRRASTQLAVILIPGALLGAFFAPQLLSLFGADYAQQGTTAFRILCASTPFVGAWYLWLGLLRAKERSRALVVLPIGMLSLLLTGTFLVAGHADLAGVATAWLLSNIPFGLWGAWTVYQHAKEVTPHVPTRALGRAAHAE